MTTASTSAAIAQSSNATFQAWVQEIYTNLVTNCGLSQTADTGQMAVPCATAAPGGANASAGYYVFRFTDALCLGPVSTVNGIVGGSGYNGGVTHTFTAVPLTGGTGSGAQATVVITSGVVTAVTITTAGTGYNACDQLSASNANLGGSGSGFTCQVHVLTSGTPIVFKLEFGSAAASTTPGMWVTVGFSTNAAGTIDGSPGTTMMTRVCVLSGTAPTSTVLPYTSRYVYTASLPFLGMIFKLGSLATVQALGGFCLFRTNDGNGNATAAGVVLIACSFNASFQGAAGAGAMQILSQANSQVYPTTLGSAACGGFQTYPYTGGNQMPFNLATTYEAGNVFIFPFYTMDPVLRYSAFAGAVLLADVPLNNTFSTAIIGLTAITFLNVGQPFGAAAVGNSQYGSSQLAIPWQ